MKFRKRHSLIGSAVLASFLFSSLALGRESGPGASGGGDARCVEYSNFAGFVASTLMRIGQEKVDAVTPIARVSEIWEIKKKLRCIPKKRLPRMAISYPGQALTDLDGEKWERANINTKLTVNVHELNVLAGYENDGEYFITEPLVELLKLESSEFRNKINDNDPIVNPDGSVTLIAPGVYVRDTRYRLGLADSNCGGICLFLGYSSCSFGSVTSPYNESLLAEITNGQLSRLTRPAFIVDSVVCWK